jgi:hypothetical protein
MKKYAVVCVGIILLVVLSGCATSQSTGNWRTYPPLPADMKIQPPPAGLPENIAALSGAWAGQWGGAGASIPCTIVIERITPQEVSAIYSAGDFTRDPDPPGWRRVKGTVDGDKIVLRWEVGEQPDPRRDRVTMTLQKKGSVFAEYQRGPLFIRGYFDKKE